MMCLNFNDIFVIRYFNQRYYFEDNMISTYLLSTHRYYIGCHDMSSTWSVFTVNILFYYSKHDSSKSPIEPSRI